MTTDITALPLRDQVRELIERSAYARKTKDTWTAKFFRALFGVKRK